MTFGELASVGYGIGKPGFEVLVGLPDGTLAPVTTAHVSPDRRRVVLYPAPAPCPAGDARQPETQTAEAP